MNNKIHRSITICKKLNKELDELAEKENRTFSNLVETKLKKSVEKK